MDEYERMQAAPDDAWLAECFEMARASEGLADEIARSLDGFEFDAIGFEPPERADETEPADRIQGDMQAIPDDFADECTMSYQLFEEDAASFDIPL